MRGSATGLAFEDLGTTSKVTACSFCNHKNLPETVVLLAYSEDGEPIGNKYACDQCAAAARRAGVLGRFAGKPRNRDPRLR